MAKNNIFHFAKVRMSPKYDFLMHDKTGNRIFGNKDNSERTFKKILL
jgi:hypothetical protein